MAEPIVFPKGNNYEWQQVTHSGRTKFQDDTVRTIVTSDEFDFACTDFELPAESTYSGPFNFLWYDKKGRLHILKIGQKRVLREIVMGKT